MHVVEYSTIGDAIADLGRRRSYAPGDLLFVEGDGSHSVYVVLEGRVRIFLTTPSGRELLVGIKAPGDEFGELSALDGRPRSASAAAIDHTVVAVLPAARYMDLLLASSTPLGVGVPEPECRAAPGERSPRHAELRTARWFAPAGCSSSWPR